MANDREWYDLPGPIAAARLIAIRNELRRSNLHDTEEPPLTKLAGPVPDHVRAARTHDGAFNDLTCPMMGATGARFGRNVPLAETVPDLARLLTPNPRTVSRTLFTRTAFQPVPFLNVLAASWIQFQVHDWFAHADGTNGQFHEIPLTADDPWPDRPDRRVPRPTSTRTRTGGTARRSTAVPPPARRRSGPARAA